MNDIDSVYNIYKPLKVDKINSCYLLDTIEGKIIVKANSKIDYSSLFKYLNSRSFKSFPKLIDIRDNNTIFEYQEDIVIDDNQKALDLIKTMALLHSKTCYFKDVSSDIFIDIYNSLKNNVFYLEDSFNSYFDSFIIEDAIIPSHNLFLNNFSSFYGAIKCQKDLIEKWYLNVKDLNKMRVCVNHNNLSLDHFIKNESEYLISWDKYVIDTPVLDFVYFYKKEWGSLEFTQLFESYDNIFHLLDNERMLLCILLLDIDNIDFYESEFNNCLKVRKLINYLDKTYELYKLIWPENFE